MRSDHKRAWLEPGNIVLAGVGLICMIGARFRKACCKLLPPRAFSDEVDTGSSKKMRPNKKLEHFPTKWTPVRRRKCDQ
ncbi:MAG: hypothetical protein KDJ45_14675, partial [Hyphomicrobiaceae bacterium]|nr:hypothetical protein [Hyphomicrobiaceae bacterium]